MHELALPTGMRVTPQRRAVLHALGRTRGAFTVNELFRKVQRRDPAIGVATVYRTIELLRESGGVRLLSGSRSLYIRCHPGHHHHLVCLGCGVVEETELCAAPTAAELRRRHGFTPESHEFDIYGTCRRCAAA